MEAIICDISAWQYWCTPPVLRDVEIPLGVAAAERPDGLGLSWAASTPRVNCRPLESLLRGRLLTILKGLSIPVHVMLPESARYSSGLIAAHRIPKDLPPSCVVDLGNGLGVLSPSYLLALAPRGTDPVKLALLMFEACGIYALSPENERMTFALEHLIQEGELKENGALSPATKICEFYDSDGKRATFLDEDGEELPWSICVPSGKLTSNLWKRPPLTSIEQLTELSHRLKGESANRTFSRALNLTIEGSASPLESKIALFLTASMRLGGEGWPKPQLNRRINFDARAVNLAYQGHCVADQLYPDTKGIIEVDGEGFHSGNLSLKKEMGRTAALESMGYRVVTFTSDQVSDLENYDSLIEQRAEILGLPLANRTAKFLAHRDKLHAKLFSRA